MSSRQRMFGRKKKTLMPVDHRGPLVGILNGRVMVNGGTVQGQIAVFERYIHTPHGEGPLEGVMLNVDVTPGDRPSIGAVAVFGVLGLASSVSSGYVYVNVTAPSFSSVLQVRQRDEYVARDFVMRTANAIARLPQ